MCLITFAIEQHPKYKLILVANRDEFFERSTAPLYVWEDYPHILAGRDLQAGGTWMGVNNQGALAALTNYRDMDGLKKEAPSRGDLTADFLKREQGAYSYIKEVSQRAHQYNGFNLLIGDSTGMYYASNYTKGVRQLDPGVYGLSNALLDSDWVKVQESKRRLTQAIQQHELSLEDLAALLKDTTLAEDHYLPNTGMPYEWEKILSSMYIQPYQGYGTRCSTVILQDYNERWEVMEIGYDEQMREVYSVKKSF
ncbi:NRDE family protein [Algivirga pacifica]|uniref:NRDE family protein n=1 Tax=Algivirga pacifica TaxID=1162670 RepID=A0ABP9D791_9BACT